MVGETVIDLGQLWWCHRHLVVDYVFPWPMRELWMAELAPQPEQHAGALPLALCQ